MSGLPLHFRTRFHIVETQCTRISFAVASFSFQVPAAAVKFQVSSVQLCKKTNVSAFVFVSKTNFHGCRTRISVPCNLLRPTFALRIYMYILTVNLFVCVRQFSQLRRFSTLFLLLVLRFPLESYLPATNFVLHARLLTFSLCIFNHC